ncbi:hypothetical protein SLA2020_153960 [Shorea laevis]
MTPIPSVVDVSAKEIYVQEFRIPSNIVLEVINCSWMTDRENADVFFHLEFNPVGRSTNNGEEQGTVMDAELVLHSIVLWNARGAMRPTFWEMVRILHWRTTPDILMIFNTGVAKNRIIPVGEDRVEFDGEFTAPATNNMGGVVCCGIKAGLMLPVFLWD